MAAPKNGAEKGELWLIASNGDQMSRDRKIMLEKIRNYAPKTALKMLHYARKTSNYARKRLLFLMF